MSKTMILGRGRPSVKIVEVGREVIGFAVDLELTIVKVKLPKGLVFCKIIRSLSMENLVGEILE